MKRDKFLSNILRDMDIPRMRIDDTGWLIRNLGFRNHEHHMFDIAMDLLLLEKQEKDEDGL